MSKSVLVIDTPESCRKCPLHSFDSFSLYCKAVVDDWGWCSPARKICDNHEKCVKPNWCPLSPLPEKKDLTRYVQRGDAKSMTHMVQYMYDSGWNACREEILKGEK
jgi:hypothetical protein